MGNIRVRIEAGKLVGDAPPGFEDGTELELTLADPGDEWTPDEWTPDEWTPDEMTPAELNRLNLALEEAWRAIREGRVRPAEDVLRDLRSEG